MKIAIDVSPLQTGHKVRGVGFYLKHLKDALEVYFPQHDYFFFTETKELHGSIDLVHYPYFDPFFVTLPLIKRYPTVVTVHDLTPLVFPQYFPAGVKGRLRWQVQKRNLQNVNRIIADSEASKKDIVSLAGIPKAKVDVAYLAAGKEFRHTKNKKTVIDELQKKYKLPDKFVLYVGDVTWNKSLPNLIKAVIKNDVPLVMVGKSLVQKDFDKLNPWNNDLTQVQTLANGHPKIFRLGFVPTNDLVTIYNMAVCFVMPSRYEGFGLPVIEAMQSGCPVITTKNGSLQEVAGEAAVYVEAEDFNSIAAGIKHVYNNESLQKELSQKGIKRAKEFSWKNTAFQTLEVYEKVAMQSK